MSKLYVIGSGPGDKSFLTDIAVNTLSGASRVLNTRELPLAELLQELKEVAFDVTAVLVSGDCGFFSIARTIIKEFSEIYNVELIPGISSVQYFCSKLKISYDDAVLFSLHGRGGSIVPKVSYNKKVIALTGGSSSAQAICGELYRYGLGDLSVSVGERLSYQDEKIITGRASELKDLEFDSLSVIYIENQAAVNPHLPLCDNDFIRDDIPMTKEEIRWLSIQKLGVNPGDIVFDIGAGTGSVSVELARKAFDGLVYAIDMKDAACSLIKANSRKHGAYNLKVIQGAAPSALDGLPVPAKAFVGGTAGNMDGILEKLLMLNPSIKLTVNVITLQTLNRTMDCFEKRGVSNIDVICVNIAKSKKVGVHDLMTAQNPIYIITGTGGGIYQ